MARKQKHEEHENHERWLVSYADFITLLFAFFVVMYSVSSVNEGKYRVLSDALVAAFRAPAKSMLPIQVGQQAKSPAGVEFSVKKSPSVINTFNRPLPQPNYTPEKEKEKQAPQPSHAQTPSEAAAAIQKMADEIEHAMKALIQDQLIKVRRSTFWLEVEINTSILYPSGSARLESDAVPVLEKLAKILQPFPNAIHVEGFTDDVPISTLAFPSNWELSAARAASVVTLFAKGGIDPARLAAIGYGEFRPVADNATDEGRARNRRVVVVVLSGTDQRNVFGAKPPPPSSTPPQPQPRPQPPASAQPAAPASVSPAPLAAATPRPAAPLAHQPGEPVDVTSQDVTEVRHFPVIHLPIDLPFPGRPALPLPPRAELSAPPPGQAQ